jgi:hypothetical protein
MSDRFLEQRINIKFCVKLSLEMEHGAFSMIPEACDVPTTQENSHVEIANEDNAHHFLRYEGYCSLWIHYIRPNSQQNLLYGNTVAVTWNCV